MPVGNAIQAGDNLVHARVVLHRARAERIHSEIDGVIPSGKPGEVADDFDLAYFGQLAKIFSFGRTKKLCGVYFGYIERSQSPRGFAGGRLFEDQTFVLADVAS